MRTRDFALFSLCLVIPLCPRCLCGESSPLPPAATRLTSDGDFKQHLAWSPDGKKLLFTRIHAGKMALWTVNADGSDLKRLLPGVDTPHFDGQWAPDGGKVVFVYDVLQGTDGKLHIHTVNADGSDNKVLIPNKAFEESPRFSPDGKRLVFVSTRDGNQELYAADADGKNIRRLTSEIAMDNNPSWSPDGVQLAFCSGRSGNLEIYAMKADGSDVRRLTTEPKMDYWPAWAPDGKRLAFISNRDGGHDVYVLEVK